MKESIIKFTTDSFPDYEVAIPINRSRALNLKILELVGEWIEPWLDKFNEDSLKKAFAVCLAWRKSPATAQEILLMIQGLLAMQARFELSQSAEMLANGGASWRSFYMHYIGKAVHGYVSLSGLLTIDLDDEEDLTEKMLARYEKTVYGELKDLLETKTVIELLQTYYPKSWTSPRTEMPDTFDLYMYVKDQNPTGTADRHVMDRISKLHRDLKLANLS